MSQKRREDSSKSEMSDDHSDREGSVEHEADFVDTIGDMEVELRLPLEIDMEQDRPRENIRTHSGVVARARLISVRRSSVDLSPRMGPGLNGTDTDCPCRSLCGIP